MGHQGAKQALGQHKQRDDHQVFDHTALAGGGDPRCDGIGVDMTFLPSFPAEEVPASKNEQHQCQPAQQSNNAQRAPQERIGRGNVANQWVIRKVVGIRVWFVRAVRYGSPGRPREERRQLTQLLWVADKRGL